jgi:hypothetical protein
VVGGVAVGVGRVGAFETTKLAGCPPLVQLRTSPVPGLVGPSQAIAPTGETATATGSGPPSGAAPGPVARLKTCSVLLTAVAHVETGSYCL